MPLIKDVQIGPLYHHLETLPILEDVVVVVQNFDCSFINTLRPSISKHF